MKGFALHLHINFNVLAGGRDADVAKPSPNDVEFNASLQEVHCSSVTKSVGADSFRLKLHACECGSNMSLDDDIDAVASDALSTSIHEQRSRWLAGDFTLLNVQP